MRKFILGTIAGAAAVAMAACATAGGTRVGTLNNSGDGDIYNVPITMVHTTDGRTLPCIVIENATTGSNSYALTIDCDWSKR